MRNLITYERGLLKNYSSQFVSDFRGYNSIGYFLSIANAAPMASSGQPNKSRGSTASTLGGWGNIGTRLLVG